MPTHYGEEKLFAAMRTCLTDQRSLRERLLDAWTAGLYRLTEQNFPPGQWKKFENLKKAMSSTPAHSGVSTYETSVNSMTEEKAKEWLIEILSLYQAAVVFEARRK
jgi:hypothetical protein